MLHTKVTRFALSLTFLLAACAGAESAASSSANLVEACEGTYDCRVGTEVITSKLTRQDGQCYAGTIALRPDGTADVSGTPATWTGNAGAFELCVSDGCLACARQGSDATTNADAGPPPPSHCVGTPRSCSAYDNDARCSDVPGCREDFFAGGYASVCEGEPWACERSLNAESCNRPGCRWE